MIMAHELAHIVLGHTLSTLDSQYAFHHRMLIPGDELLSRLSFRRDQREEKDANRKAVELLSNSPYKDKLGDAGLFLRALAAAAPHEPNLVGAHLGNRLFQASRVPRMAELMKRAPDLEPGRLDQIAALPLGARIVIDSWSDSIELAQNKPIALLSAREKKPFEITPLFPYLTRLYGSARPAPLCTHSKVERPGTQRKVSFRRSNLSPRLSSNVCLSWIASF